jgi:hypothetical protein
MRFFVILNQNLNTRNSPAFEMWVKSYDKTSRDNMLLAATFYSESVKSLLDVIAISSDKLLKPHVLKKQFIKHLDLLIIDKTGKVYNKCRNRFSEVETLQQADFLTDTLLAATNALNVCIAAPIKT